MSAPVDGVFTRTRASELVFAFCVCVTWLVLHTYWGIIHDSILYTAQALKYLQPDVFGNDIFFRYGSQDRYTIFSPFYAFFIRALGLYPAAALLAFVGEALLLAGCFFLACRLMPARIALLAIGMLVTLDLPYGGRDIFHIFEEFVSPRPFAEALVLFAIGAALQTRDLAALLLLGLACAIHPIMGMAGVALLLWLRVVAPRPRVAAAGIAVAFVALIAVALGPLRHALVFDDEWYGWVMSHAPYLPLSGWTPLDWSRSLPPLVTLVVATLTLQAGPVRSLAIAAIGIEAGGLALTWVGGDWLHVVLVVQAQPWRWQWLATTLAILIVPLVCIRLWSLGAMGRATLALLIATYFFADEPYAYEVAFLASVAAIWMAFRWPRIEPAHQKWILRGAAGVLALAVSYDIANRYIYSFVPLIDYAGHPYYTLFRRIARDTCLLAALLAGLWWLCFRGAAWMLGAIAMATAVASAFVAPVIIGTWETRAYSPEAYHELAAWRERIPPKAEVLYAPSPLLPWLLLDRPSYMTAAQSLSSLFSRRAAVAIAHRIAIVSPLLAGEGEMASPDGRAAISLAQLCAHSDVSYIVTHEALGPTPLDTLPMSLKSPLRGLRLYQCQRHR